MRGGRRRGGGIGECGDAEQEARGGSGDGEAKEGGGYSSFSVYWTFGGKGK